MPLTPSCLRTASWTNNEPWLQLSSIFYVIYLPLFAYFILTGTIHILITFDPDFPKKLAYLTSPMKLLFNFLRIDFVIDFHHQ